MLSKNKKKRIKKEKIRYYITIRKKKKKDLKSKKNTAIFMWDKSKHGGD